jgi:hypothetical protein
VLTSCLRFTFAVSFVSSETVPQPNTVNSKNRVANTVKTDTRRLGEIIRMDQSHSSQTSLSGGIQTGYIFEYQGKRGISQKQIF